MARRRAASKPKVSAQTVMMRTGMLVQPREKITPGVIMNCKYKLECTPLYGGLEPGERFRIIEIDGLKPNESYIGVAGGSGMPPTFEAPGQPSGFVVLDEQDGSVQLKLTGTECRNHFEAIL